jgi:hypothetical protein
MVASVYLRQKADQCRRLSAGIRGDAAASALQALAVEFDNKAAVVEAETATAVLIGFGVRSGSPTNGHGQGERHGK